ncbi:uncharacterized protein YdgA (DUF945 family) [Cricetibacter osteomyelitidis]|uniref:Uncharacterized protein YdgA (DUF945 family) n=1 Tax=Cricetibacter osteomyelitidis TaxID=1521931 RepID=A0A4R2SV42_9PAST|nr:YdgA family protein [Cricetibacter osteomyelitidis]TCP92214.1 uncharacterized protein YdgA (DUF945 family) [Cricetibacter osteomyelitidis]
MKKSTVAISVIVALGAVWTGGAWYTGQKAQTEYERQIQYVNEKVNKSLEFYGVEIKIEPVKFERGLFTSEYAYNMKITTDNAETDLPISGKLYHGPIPLNTFTPAIFSTDYELVNNEQTKALFDAAQGKKPLTGKFTFSYTEQISGDLDAPLIVYNNNNVTTTFENLKLVYDTDKNGIGKTEATIGAFKAISSAAGEKRAADVEVTNIKVKSDLTATKWEYLTVGKQEIAVENVKLTNKTDVAKTFELKNMSVTSETDAKDNFFNVMSKVNVADVLGNNQSFGTLDVDMQFNHLEADTMNAFVVESLNENERELEALGLKLLQNQPHFILKPIFTNSAGKLDGNLNIELNQFDVNNVNSVLSLFKQFEFGADFNKAALKQFIISAAQVFENMDNATAEQFAEKQLKNLEMSKHTWVNSDDKLTTALKLVDSKLILNNTQEISEQEIQMALFMLMMGLGSLGQ